MPIYDYECPTGHRIERLRKAEARDDRETCHCGLDMRRTLSRSHVAPDGVYSHCANLGNANDFDRRYEEGRAKRR